MSFARYSYNSEPKNSKIGLAYGRLFNSNPFRQFLRCYTAFPWHFLKSTCLNHKIQRSYSIYLTISISIELQFMREEYGSREADLRTLTQ